MPNINVNICVEHIIMMDTEGAHILFKQRAEAKVTQKDRVLFPHTTSDHSERRVWFRPKLVTL